MRSKFIFGSAFVLIAIGFAGIWQPAVLWSLVVLVPLILLGMIDMIQTRQAIRRNFPLFGRLRYLFESIRPEIQQYFVETDTAGLPLSRLHRSVIYQRAKRELDTTPFGTQLNVYDDNYEWLNHSVNALDFFKINEHPRVVVGGPDCLQPYSSSVYNISAMSYGSLSKNAILAL